MSSDEILPGLGQVPRIGGHDALFTVVSQPVEVHGEVDNPVAHVHIEVTHAHLDRIYDYLIPASMNEDAQVGVRVDVPFGARTLSGYIISRDNLTYQGATLRPLKRVVSPVPVLSSSMYSFFEKVADAYACTISDILRVAIVQRHRRAENSVLESPLPAYPSVTVHTSELWNVYDNGARFIDELTSGFAPRAVCGALPGKAGGTELIMSAISAALQKKTSVIIVTSTTRNAANLAEKIYATFHEPITMMTGNVSHEERYTSFVSALTGRSRIVVGTRSAVWAPAKNVGLIIVLDDASEHMREQRVPYYEARDIAIMRAEHENAAFLAFSPYISEESLDLVHRDRAFLLEGTRHAVSYYAPRVSTVEQWRGGDTDFSRIPEPVFTLVREAITRGPVLFVVPFSGYLPVIACQTCRASVTCTVCGGNLELENQASLLTCKRCGSKVKNFRCDDCGGQRFRAIRIGSMRTAQEIAKAFPGFGVISSSSVSEDGIASRVDNKPRIVVATPGAEPTAQGGFSAAVIVDSRFLLGEGLDAQTQFLRTVTRVAVRVRPRSEGGHLLLAGGADKNYVRVLNEWRLADYAHHLLAERSELALPPTATWIRISGESEDIRRFLGIAKSLIVKNISSLEENTSHDIMLTGGLATLAPGIELLGPHTSPYRDDITIYMRFAREQHTEVAAQVALAYRQYAALHMGRSLHIEVNPRL